MWRHVVDKDWMKARSRLLTASNIKNILPVTETGRKRSQAQIEANMMKVVASMSTLYIPVEECVSTGAAARGHLLEPIAIKEAVNLGLYHWDDVVFKKGILGWSPDALSIPQDGEFLGDKGLYDIDKKGAPCPSAIGEVKSYGMEKHTAAVYMDKELLPERWQLAVGMLMLPCCRGAHLIFFNPDSRDRLAVKTYTRKDLEEEIEMIEEAVVSFAEFLSNLPKVETKNTYLYFNNQPEKNSDYFLNQIMGKQRMNI